MIADHIMPAMTGLEMIEQLHAGQNLPRTVFVTGGRQDIFPEAIKMGVHAVFQKPLRRESFLRFIENVSEDYKRGARRAHSRIESDSPIEVSVPGATSRCRALDFSFGGIRLTGDCAVLDQRPAEIVVRFDRFEVAANVVWYRGIGAGHRPETGLAIPYSMKNLGYYRLVNDIITGSYANANLASALKNRSSSEESKQCLIELFSAVTCIFDSWTKSKSMVLSPFQRWL